MKMRDFLKNKLGFSLTEIMVAVGIMGVISTVIMNYQQQAVDTTRDLVVETEINSLLQNVVSQLNKKEVCELNFKNKDVAQASIATLTQRVDTLTLTNINIISTVAPDNKFSNEITITGISSANNPTTANQMDLTIDYQVRNRTPAKKIIVPIKYYLDTGTGKILSCFSDLQFMLRRAVEYACQGNGARYIAPTASGIGSCEHVVELRKQDGSLENISAGSFLCPPGQFLQKIADGACSVAPNVNLDAAACATASGVWSSNKMVFHCGSVTSTCGAWEYLKGYNADGTPQCQDVRQLFTTTGFIALKGGVFVTYNIGCASNEVLKGINADGSPNCINPEYSKNCLAGQYITGVDLAGNPQCSDPAITTACTGSTPFIKAISNNGDVTCQSGAPGGSCTPGSQVIGGIDSAGNVTCKSVPL